MLEKLTWGILGTGSIANIFAKGLATSQTGELLAVGSRTQDTANAFGAKWNITHCHGSYEQLLADKDVQAIYISTPHPLHAKWAIQAAEAGIHILCEKPIALNAAEAVTIIDAARSNNVFLMEAFMYRCHPQTETLVELIRSGAIGKVRTIQATFSFDTDFNLKSRLLNNSLGGGGILDVGGYCVSMARLIAGAANGERFANPTQVLGAGHIGALSHVDEYATALLTFPGDIFAQLLTGVQLNAEDEVKIFGTQGTISIPCPWLPAQDGRSSTIILNKYGEMQPQEIAIESQADLYTYEADTVARYIDERQSPTMSWDDTLGNMQTLDRWRAAIGLVYAAERSDA